MLAPSDDVFEINPCCQWNRPPETSLQSDHLYYLQGSPERSRYTDDSGTEIQKGSIPLEIGHPLRSRTQPIFTTIEPPAKVLSPKSPAISELDYEKVSTDEQPLPPSDSSIRRSLETLVKTRTDILKDAEMSFDGACGVVEHATYLSMYKCLVYLVRLLHNEGPTDNTVVAKEEQLTAYVSCVAVGKLHK